MDEKSIWKKEISFGRKSKPKPEPEEQSELEASEGGAEESAKPASIWKKEISFRRKPKEAVPRESAPTGATAADEEPPEAEAESDEPVWKRAVSFTSKAEHAKAVEADAETVPSDSDRGSDPEPGPEEPVWTKEVSLSPKNEAEEESVAEPAEGDRNSDDDTEPVADQAPAAPEGSRVPADEGDGSDPEPRPEEPVWTREVSLRPKADADEEPTAPIAAEASAEEPVALEADRGPSGDDSGSDPETGLEETVWKREVSFNRKTEEAAEPVVEVPVAQEPVPAAEPPLSAQPQSAPIAAELPASMSVPAPVLHPPVPAAELPPLAAEAAAKVPFWKKEISLGGKKRDKAPKAERAPKVKKEKEPKPPKQSKQPKEPKERKEKAPRVKRERGGAKGSKRLVGLKVGASQLAAARVGNNGSAELLQVARGPLEPGIIVGGELRDPDALAVALKAFFAQHKLPKRGVRIGIASNRIGVRTFEIAGVEDEKQLANAILFRAQEALPIPIDEAVLDYQVLGSGVDESGQPTRRILLVVAYRELIDRYVDACKKAGIVLAGIDLEAFALLRAVQAPQDGVGNDPSAALVAVAVGHERSTFAVSDGRICEFTRVLEWGGSTLNVALARVLDAAPSEVEDVKRSLSLVDATVPHGLDADQGKRAVEAVRKSVQAFARELVSSLQYYQNQPGSLGIGEIVVTGGTAHLPGLAAELERLIGVRVRIGDPLARMKVAKKVGDPEQVGSLAVAIGLGIED